MGALATAVAVRDTAGRLVQLTNYSTNAGKTATTSNSTVLDAAEADVAAEFMRAAGVTFDSSIARHLAIGVRGMWAILAKWKGQEGGSADWDAFISDCEDFRATGANRRVQTIGTRSVGPSSDVDASGAQRRPNFDAPRFSDIDVEPPAGGS